MLWCFPIEVLSVQFFLTSNMEPAIIDTSSTSFCPSVRFGVMQPSRSSSACHLAGVVSSPSHHITSSATTATGRLKCWPPASPHNFHPHLSLPFPARCMEKQRCRSSSPLVHAGVLLLLLRPTTISTTTSSGILPQCLGYFETLSHSV